MSAASDWLQQAECELLTTRTLLSHRLNSPAVFHGQQVVEMSLKSAMLRTCGLTPEEQTGATSHDLAGFHSRLCAASQAASCTEEQREAVEAMPGSQADMAWLKRAYLAARYPNACTFGKLPAHGYDDDDATRAMQLAEHMFQWSKHLSDLPTAGEVRARQLTVLEEQDPELPLPFQFSQPEAGATFAPVPRLQQQENRLPVGSPVQDAVTGQAPAPPALEGRTKRRRLSNSATGRICDS